MENASEANTDDDEIFEDFCPPKYALNASLSPTLENNQLNAYTNNSTQDKHSIGEYYVFQSGIPPDSNIMHSEKRCRHESRASIVDGLLSEIYDRWHDHRHDSFDSDTFTECSSTSEFVQWRRNSLYQDLEIGGRQIGYHLHRGLLLEYGKNELGNLVNELIRRVNQMSARLVRQLKRRERRMHKLQNNCDIVTAIIQASSPKRRIDTRMKFSVEPSFGDNAFEQWKDAMKAVARLPLGIPDEFRKKVWLSLASHHIQELKIDWEKTIKFAFNEKSNPDDNKLGLQIVKDLHRTGCSGYSGEDNEEERALLKRILLAYARWNKAVGYCQGFNVIAALLLEVMDRKEADALKVMIYLIDHVLPQSYFDNNLRALSVDMAVFRDLLKIFPKLSRHLDYLQHAQDQASGGCYEPPLTNVFTMQWFLTLFATCLPKATVLRVWDCILLEGSEILLRTALTIWGKLSSRIQTVSTADEFYTLMGDLTQDMLEGNVLDADTMIKSIYCIAPFPFPQLTELREKYTYNIRPFTPASKKAAWGDGSVLPSDEDDLEDEEIEAMTCFTGFIPITASGGLKSRERGEKRSRTTHAGISHSYYKSFTSLQLSTTAASGLEGDQRTGSVPDISSLGPGAYSLGPSESSGTANVPAYMERMTTDISALKKQYAKLRQRQAQAHIILNSASYRQQPQKTKPIAPTIETPIAVNHLFLTKHGIKGKNRFVAASPRIANMYPETPPYSTSNTGQRKIQPINPQLHDDRTKLMVKEKWKEPANQTNSSVTAIKLEKIAEDNPKLNEEFDKQAGKIETGNETAIVEHCNDSGLGTSLSSPVHSYSSTDCSPKHSSEHSDHSDAKMDTSGCSQQLDEFYEKTRDAWESDDVSDSNTELTRDSDKSAIESIGNTKADEISEFSDGASSSKHVVARQIDDDTVDANARQMVSSDDNLGSRVENTDSYTHHQDSEKHVDQQEKMDLTLKIGSEDNMETSVPTKASKSDNYRSHSDGARFKQSELRLSNSSGSGIDSDHLPEVFSPDNSNTHAKSFQQYYNNKRNLSIDSASSLEAQLKKCNVRKKTFNPFPVKHVNQNRAKTGIKLGLYKQSTLEEFERNLKNQSVWGK